MGNRIKTTFLLTAMTSLFLVLGYLLGGQGGMFIALIFAGGMNFFSYWYSHKIVLKMYRAQPLDRNQAPELFDMVARLARQADLPMPEVYLIPEAAPNAFATGRNPDNAVVAVTQGLVNLMDSAELEGVIAHELGHIKNRDILISTIAATMAGAIMWLATMARFSAIFGGSDDEEGGMGLAGVLVMSIIAPMAAMLVQMAVSRSREYLADATAATITGNPGGLASALSKLGSYSRGQQVDANPSTAHMFIVNPLSASKVAGLFSTHPPIEERVKRLGGRSSGGSSGGGFKSEFKGGSGDADFSSGPARGGKRPTMEEQSKSFWDNLS